MLVDLCPPPPEWKELERPLVDAIASADRILGGDRDPCKAWTASAPEVHALLLKGLYDDKDTC